MTTMRCLRQPPHISIIHAILKPSSISKPETTHLWLSNDSKRKQRINFHPFSPKSSRKQPQSLPTASLILLRSSPAVSGDYSTIIPISVGLLLIYWVANFFVPNLISKGFEPLNPHGDGKETDKAENLIEEEDRSSIDTPVSSRKRKGKKSS